MPLAANALTTVAALAGELGIPVPVAGSAEEAKLERRIAVASAAVEDYCGRKFGRAVLTEKVPGKGGQVLFLDRAPVQSITSVTLDGQVVAPTEYLCEGTDAAVAFLRHRFACWENTADWQRGAAPEPLAGSERALYVVVYVAGYVLPKDATSSEPATLPPVLEEACLLTAVASHRAAGRDTSIVSESLLSATVTYANPAQSGAVGVVPATAVALLAPYRRLV